MAELLKRFLIVRTDRIGDVILTLPMAKAVKKQFPDAYIVMLIRRYTTELVEDDQNVDEILFYDDNDRLVPFFQLVASMRAQQFDVVFHTHPRFRLALITWLARIPIRAGTGYRWYSFLFNRKIYEHRKDAKRHELEYNLNLLTTIGCTVDPVSVAPILEVKMQSIQKVRDILNRNGVPDNHLLVLLHPGSGGSARDWGFENFGRLGHRLAQFPNTTVIITGGSNERFLVDKVCRIVGSTSVALVNQLNLKEYAALAKLSSLFIANSTGTIHIAAAVGTPVIGLYPQVVPLSAARWGPYTEKKIIFTPANRPVDCKKCLSHKKKVCECMESISVEEVYKAAVNYLVKN